MILDANNNTKKSQFLYLFEWLQSYKRWILQIFTNGQEYTAKIRSHIVISCERSFCRPQVDAVIRTHVRMSWDWSHSQHLLSGDSLLRITNHTG